MSFDTDGLIEKENQRGVKYYTKECGKVIARECTKCKEVKNRSKFNKDKRRIGEIRSSCKKCEKRYREENREMIAKNKSKYYIKNRGRLSKMNANNYQKNRDYYLAKATIYRQKNRERINEYFRNNKEKRSIYRENNRHLYRLSDSRRKARARNLPNSLTIEQKTKLLAHFGAACALSGDKGEEHLDHVIPLSVGHGGTIYENMIPLRADLNQSKSNRNIFDWFADNRDRFGLEQRKFDELIEYLADINDMTTQEYEKYVRWCHDNPRTIDEIKADNESEQKDEGATA